MALNGLVEVLRHAAGRAPECAIPNKPAGPRLRFKLLAEGGGWRAIARNFSRRGTGVEAVADVQHVISCASEPGLGQSAPVRGVEVPRRGYTGGSVGGRRRLERRAWVPRCMERLENGSEGDDGEPVIAIVWKSVEKL